MTSVNAFDIRYPIGALFVALAVLLVPYGLFHERGTGASDINIDLWWGLCMLAFGIVLIALALMANRRFKGASRAPANNGDSNA